MAARHSSPLTKALAITRMEQPNNPRFPHTFFATTGNGKREGKCLAKKREDGRSVGVGRSVTSRNRYVGCCHLDPRFHVASTNQIPTFHSSFLDNLFLSSAVYIYTTCVKKGTDQAENENPVRIICAKVCKEDATLTNL